MRKLFCLAALAAALAFGCAPARAQNNLCADVALGDSSNRCANTRFVQGTITTNIFAGTNTWTGTNTFNPLAGNAITINPAAGSTDRALTATQTTQNSATPVAGPLSLNLFNITQSVRVTGAGSDNTGNNNAGSVGFRVNTFYTGANLAGASTLLSGLFTATVQTTAALSDVVGLAATAYTNVVMTTGGFLEGLNAISQVGPAGSANIISGADIGSGIKAGGTAVHRWGMDVGSFADTRGTTSDIAIAILGVGVNPAWQTVIGFTNAGGAAGINGTTDILGAFNAYTVSNFANLPTMVVTNNIMLFSKFALTGDGRIQLGGNSNTPPAFPVVLQAKQTSGGSTSLYSDTNTTTGTSGVDVLTSLGTNEAFLLANEPARTAVRFGQTSGNWAEVGSGGAANLGLLIGTQSGAVPVIFGTNNTERMRLLAGVMVGTTTDPGAGIINVLTGYRIGNAAASGNALIGNGTNFVSTSVNATVAPLYQNYLSGLGTSWASVTTFTVAAGVATDSTNVFTITLGSAITKSTSAWAVGSGNGGLDTGAIAATTWYHIFLIRRSDTGVVDVCFTITVTGCTTGGNISVAYDQKRRIGTALTSGASQFIKWIQDGDIWTWDVPVGDVAAANPGTAAVTRTLTVPTGIRVLANISVYVEATTSAAAPGGIFITDLSQTDTAANGTNAFSLYSFVTYTASITDAILGANVRAMTNTSGQVRSRLQTGSANTSLFMSTLGWTDFRGRNG